MQRLEQELRQLAASLRDPFTACGEVAANPDQRNSIAGSIETILARQPEAAGAVEPKVTDRMVRAFVDDMNPLIQHSLPAPHQIRSAIAAALREQATPAGVQGGDDVGAIANMPPMFQNLPKAYNGCICSCHRSPGVKHVMACCTPDLGTVSAGARLDDAALAGEAVAYFNGLGTVSAKRMADAILRTINRDLQAAATPAGATVEGLEAAQTFLDWNRSQPNPPVRVGYEYAVWQAASALAQAATGDGYYLATFKHKIGGAVMWWGPENNGYTPDIAQAGIYTDLTPGYHDNDYTIPVPVNFIERLRVRRVVDPGDELNSAFWSPEKLRAAIAAPTPPGDDAAGGA